VEGSGGEGKEQGGKEFEGATRDFRHEEESSTKHAGGTRWRRAGSWRRRKRGLLYCVHGQLSFARCEDGGCGGDS
jgi:hypothetical protein